MSDNQPQEGETDLLHISTDLGDANADWLRVIARRREEAGIEDRLRRPDDPPPEEIYRPLPDETAHGG